jgi:hypothetical protein
LHRQKLQPNGRNRIQWDRSWPARSLSSNLVHDGHQWGFYLLLTSCTTGIFGVSTGLIVECTVDACSTISFSLSGNNVILVNCIASNSTAGTGFGGSAIPQCKLINCATYNNLTPVSGIPWANLGLIALSADPYVSQSTGDLRLNNNTPGGGQLRAAGFGVFGQINNEDVGAVQHTDPVAGTGRRPLEIYT